MTLPKQPEVNDKMKRK